MSRWAWLVLAAGAMVTTTAGCTEGGDDDTLQPLPIEGGTVIPPPPSGSVRPSAPDVGTTTTSTIAPFGDWDGARFDAGTIDTITDVRGYRAIGFDRYSFSAPDRGTIDAEGFEEEPLVAWWRESPFSNVRVALRTFVLDPDVEVLVLDESDRAVACADPPPATPPPPSWEPADVSVLEDPAAAGGIATLTYSATGQVTRIRFTHGC